MDPFKLLAAAGYSLGEEKKRFFLKYHQLKKKKPKRRKSIPWMQDITSQDR